MSTMRRGPQDAQSGQAAVEAALTLPLTIFVILGTLQFFLLLQARTMTEYAAFLAVRTGSVKHGDCEAMTHAAVASLLPTFARTDSAATLGTAFRNHRDNLYQPAQDAGNSGAIVWIVRERPLQSEIQTTEEETFDDPARYTQPNDVMRLEARLIFWYPMRIPFANWVLGRMMLAHWGLLDYTAADPLGPVHKARWSDGTTSPAMLERAIGQEMLDRAQRQQYVFPLQATSVMRMMTPARLKNFMTQNCPLTPERL
jgi:hypothetical protein